MIRKKKFLIGGLVLVLAIAYLGYTGFVSSALYQYTLPELTEQAGSLQGTKLKVAGTVAEGTVQREPAGRTLKFTLTGGGQSLPVTYRGTVPDTFKPGAEVVLEGILSEAGVFEASGIFTKCASKYEPG
ncbi:MAG: cytochrome c maturation protein CcmE [Chloroflexi bacterium]|nr:cytochrome c maturation protein CcmE [Chloroflexota bacterium]